ncbi:hypothetical protein CERZMDRAFT_86085 [Cercospora zeae-maydis SCOH1-5]|uniref:TAP-C domain-containing protein n=1 Tax=Cercospora zeae-maydis SCOH1-5 TaxID=717836 RepID=A0A6A6FAA9_9PEZI|nr:hypothetical protein CERZMDRAFT_86085 [Cercospora zeae-maydis SCOH1-5]
MEALELEKEVAPMAYSSHAALYIVTAPGPLKLPTYIDIRDAEANVHALMTRTGMTLEYAHLALCATEWRLGKAVEAFERCKSKLDPEAFQVIHALSTRTGMTLAYSVECLASAEGNYSAAVASFNRVRSQLPPEVFITKPDTTTFFSLPPELRNEIYSLAFEAETADHIDRDDGLVPIVTPFPGLLRVNAQIRDESLGLYLCSTPFCDDYLFYKWSPKTQVKAAQDTFDWLDIIGPRNVRNNLGSLTIVSHDTIDCIHGCMPEKLSKDDFDAWDYIATSLKIRGVQAHQLRFPGMLPTDLNLWCRQYDERLISRIILNTVIAVEVFEKRVKLLNEKSRPPQMDELIELGWESQHGTAHSRLQMTSPGTASVDVEKVVEKWRRQFKKWGRGERKIRIRVNKERR